MRFIERCQAAGQVHFTLPELTAATGLSTKAAREQLAHLKGLVTRVSPRLDFFLIVSPEQRPMGAPPVFWWLDAFFKARNRPYYVALLSAAAEHGASPHAVQAVQVMTDRPMRELVVGRLRLRFFVKKHLIGAPIALLNPAHAPLLVSTPEMTSLDLLGYAHRIGGVGRASEVIAGLLTRFRKGDLRKALAAGAETPNVQRLGYVLQELGRPDLGDVVAQYLPSRKALVPLQKGMSSSPRTPGAISERWSVRVNAWLKDGST